MAFIDWTDDYSVNIDSVDSQHRQLVELVNKFDDAVRQGRGSCVVTEILNDLIGYTQEHFAFEEKLMAEGSYTKLKQHKAQHRQLLQKIERFQFDFNQSGRRITSDVHEFLRYWLTTHIQKDDKDYARELQEQLLS